MKEPGCIASIWRYMDFTKYVSMLDTECLYFCRADRFQDPFEGIPHPAFIEEQRKAIWDALSFDWGIASDTWRELDLKGKYDVARSHILVNCWHENNVESAAMWRLYLSSPEGVAIRSTTERLEKAILTDQQVHIARVEYVDFTLPLEADRLTVIPLGQTLKPFFLKRLSFSHECEVRAVIQVDEPPIHGEVVKVKLSDLIESIYVSPLSPGWFFNLVKSVSERYGISADIHQSKLYESPVVHVPANPY